MIEAFMQVLGTLLVLIGVTPGVNSTIAIASVVTGATLWFVTYFNDDDDDYI